MNFGKTFPGQVCIALIVICGLAAYPLFRYYTASVILAAAIGAALAAVNVMLGYAAIKYSMRKPANTFLISVLGGMGARLFVLAGILLVLIEFAKLEIVPLVASLGIFYVVFLVLEVVFVHKNITLKQH